MKLSISNIAWDKSNDKVMYDFLKQYEYSGIEIAPTRIFPEEPYENLHKAKIFAENLINNYNLEISSMQSIWYGIKQRVFGTPQERNFLIEYTKKAVDFANKIYCQNIVFGCPVNRSMNPGDNHEIAIEFFKKLADYAANNNTTIALEPNPDCYNTNFINNTTQAFEFCKIVNSPGLRVNIDIGTMVYYNESVDLIINDIHLVNHIHISEPNLALIKKRDLHNQLRQLDYDKYISIEMANLNDIELVKSTLKYIKEVVT